MQIQQLTYFVAIAEQGSINKAAEKLFVTQPNLSKAISNLENELKVRIFNRTNKGRCADRRGQKALPVRAHDHQPDGAHSAPVGEGARAGAVHRGLSDHHDGASGGEVLLTIYHDNRVALKAGGKPLAAGDRERGGTARQRRLAL